jgi:F0F1-type ATP synthase assembly protein I
MRNSVALILFILSPLFVGFFLIVTTGDIAYGLIGFGLMWTVPVGIVLGVIEVYRSYRKKKHVHQQSVDQCRETLRSSKDLKRIGYILWSVIALFCFAILFTLLF